MSDGFEIDISFRYLDHFEREKVIQVSSFKFDDENKHFNKPYRISYKAKTKKALICKCRSNDWRDNGRDMNEYEYGQCGMFITVI
ncbi:hypothetical protein C9446_05385 [Providencia heimbachae]|uniref:hypothetical protein n=1 Tax=Providencia heimbachae TaxID=333962 RepID=UPI0010BE2ABC|nr:hypothetical protein [Providencia heimbachae]QCJ69348.1 hypothetical protein C9446_05385 [Providencia heimbachae]